MSRHKFEIILDVDDDALGDHDGQQAAPPNEVDDWTEFSDIARAIEKGIVDPGECEVAWYNGEAKDG